MLRFEWDPDKARKNLRKHGVSFDEACGVFYDDTTITLFDAGYSTGSEERYNDIGRSLTGEILFVVYTENEETDRIRIVSARSAGAAERRRYEQGL